MSNDGRHEAVDRRPAWERFTAAVRYVLAMEPVAVAAVWRAVVVLIGAVGLVVPDVLDARVGAGIVAFYGLVEVVTTIGARNRATPWAGAVEVVHDGVVVAGPANEQRTGTPIRVAPVEGGTIFPA